MLSRNHNLIQDERKGEHSINKYEFKSIVPLESYGDPKVDSMENKIDEQTQEQVGTYRTTTQSLEKELIEKLLHKSDELSGNLAKLEMQFEKNQVSMQETIEKTSDESYKRGFEEGKNEAKQAMEAEISKEREKIVQSLITLENTLKQSQIHLEALEKELSSIAIDMAKEVIVKEIEENSQRVALELTRSLLSSIMEATQIGIKVNPIDYVFLKENLKDREKIQIEADNAISRGGVVISSNLGNLDGNVMSRYKMLKQSVLDNLKD